MTARDQASLPAVANREEGGHEDRPSRLGPARDQPSHFNAGAFRLAAVALGGVRQCGLYRHPDRDLRVGCRRRDVRHRLELADDQPQSEPPDGVGRAGRDYGADVPADDSRRGAGRRGRSAKAADRSAGLGRGGRRRLRRRGFIASGNADGAAYGDVPARRGGGAGGSGMADHHACARAEKPARQRDRVRQRGLQCEPCAGAGVRGRRDFGDQHQAPVLGLLRDQSRAARRSGVVARASPSPGNASGRTPGQRDERGPALRPLQPRSRRDPDPRRRVFLLRQRLLGADAAPRARTNARRPGALWPLDGHARLRIDRWIADSPNAAGKARA